MVIKNTDRLWTCTFSQDGIIGTGFTLLSGKKSGKKPQNKNNSFQDISELEDRAIESIQNEVERKNLKNTSVSDCSETAPLSLINV